MFSQIKNPLLCVVLGGTLGIAGCDSATVTELAAVDSSLPIGAALASTLLEQGDFESGIDAWESCDAATLPRVTADTPYGSAAAKLEKQACIYQSAAAEVGQTHRFICKTNRAGVGWAAVMLGYLDTDFNPLRTIEIEIDSLDWSDTVVDLSAPANTAYVEVLGYTTGDAELTLDNCTLEFVVDEPAIVSNVVADNFTPTVANVKRSQSFGVDADDIAGAGQIDWSEAWMVHNSLSLWVAWDIYESLDSATWGLSAYLDIDQDKNTGFRGFNDEYPIGADYLVEGLEQFVYTGNGNDWSWQLVALVGTSRVEKSTIHSIPFDRFLDTADEIDLFFRGDNESVGGSEIDYYPDNVTKGDADDSSRFFSYRLAADIPPVTVDPPPPVTPPITQVGPAMIDVRNGMEGMDTWAAGAPFEYQVSVTNTGDLPLTDVLVNSDALEDCRLSYPSLGVGETKTASCTNATESDFTHNVTATATASDGQVVTDTDGSSNRVFLRPLSRQAIVATPSSYGDGEDIVFTIEVGNTGNRSYLGEVTTLVSNIAQCERQFDPPVAMGTFERYTCLAADIQAPFTAEFSTEMATTTVNIVPADTLALDVSLEREGPDYKKFAANNTSVDVRIQNTGAVDIQDVTIGDDGSSDCSKRIALLRAGASENFSCSVDYQNLRGDVLVSTVTASGSAPDGTPVADSDSVTVLNANDVMLDVILNAGNPVALGNPGEPVSVSISLENRGYLPVTGIESLSLTTVSIDDSDVDNCRSVFASIEQDPNFNLGPGESQQHSCTVTMPASLETQSDTAYIFVRTAFSSAAVPGYDARSESQLKLKKLVAQGQPAAATVLVNNDVATHASALPDPVIDESRAQQLLPLGDFETTGADGYPAGWTKSCNGAVRTINSGDDTVVELKNDACLIYILDTNTLAQLAGKSYKLSCELGERNGYNSISVVLDAVENAKRISGFSSEELHGDAPATVTDGYVSLYSYGDINVKNCQLWTTNAAGSIASIDISNQAEGNDDIGGYGSFDFKLALKNNGGVALKDIEVSSDNLDCDTNFAALDVNETKLVLCSTTTPATRWDEVISHTALATAVTDTGVVVSDTDYAAYGGALNSYIDSVRVRLNSKEINPVYPAEPIVVARGSDVEVSVEISKATHSEVRLITSSVSSCNKIIDPPLEFGDTITYTCTLENIQPDNSRFTLEYVPVNGAFSTRVSYLIQLEQ